MYEPLGEGGKASTRAPERFSADLVHHLRRDRLYGEVGRLGEAAAAHSRRRRPNLVDKRGPTLLNDDALSVGIPNGSSRGNARCILVSIVTA